MSARQTGQSKRGAHRLTALMHCVRHFGYAYLLKLRVKQCREPLARGVCNHAGIEAHYTGKDPVGAILDVDRYYSGTVSLDAVGMIQRYVVEYPVTYTLETPEQVSEPWGKLAFVEKEFDLPLRASNGAIEVMTRRLDTGIERPDRSLVILDHKTAWKPSDRVRKADIDVTLFTQEMVGRIVSEALGLKWGGLYLNLLPSGSSGSFRRDRIAYTGEFLAGAERDLADWLQLESLLTTKFDRGEFDPWKAKRSFNCYPGGYACDYKRLCLEGQRALLEYEINPEL